MAQYRDLGIGLHLFWQERPPQNRLFFKHIKEIGCRGATDQCQGLVYAR